MVMSAGLGGSAGQEQSTRGASLEGRFEREGKPPPPHGCQLWCCLAWAVTGKQKPGTVRGRCQPRDPQGRSTAAKFLGMGAKKEEEVVTGSSGATCAPCLVLGPPRI